MTNDLLKAYSQSRDLLVTEITKTLSVDQRFLAAWLTGSFGRNDFDAVSDLDLTVVVSDEFSEKLCARPEMVSTQTTQERLDLIEKFGRVAVIHENNHNAPEGGTFTFALYVESALMVDWVLIPLKNSYRPHQSRLLFDKAGIPLAPKPTPETLEQRVIDASENVAFFWMMTAITAKYIVRRDNVFVQLWLEELHKLIKNVKRLVAGRPWEYKRGSVGSLALTVNSQVNELRRLCNDMLILMPEVVKIGGKISSSPVQAIEVLLNLAIQENDL